MCLSSFLKTTRFACRQAKELGIESKAAEWANAAMQGFIEEVEEERTNEVLLWAAAGVAEDVWESGKALSKKGLDERVLGRFLEALKKAIENK